MNKQNISQQINECNKIKDKEVTSFTNDMTFIINSMVTKNSKDDELLEVRDKYITAKNENKDCILLQAGPYFWKYRENISSGNLNPLLNSDFREDIAEKQGTLPDYSASDKIQIIMSKVKRTWHLLTPQEQEILKKKFRAMLASYSTYVSNDKKILLLKSPSNNKTN